MRNVTDSSRVGKVSPLKGAESESAFYRRFVQAIDGTGPSEFSNDLLQQPGFAVYRNTALLAAIDALKANFPSVRTLVGEECMHTLAECFARRRPPGMPSLLRYGAGFSDFLRDQDELSDLPYLTHIAELDTAWIHAHCAADAAAISVPALDSLIVADHQVVLHPAASAHWFSQSPAASVWLATRQGASTLYGIAWQASGVLITRPNFEVHLHACDQVSALAAELLVKPIAISELLGLTAAAHDAQSAGCAFFQLVTAGAVCVAAVTDHLKSHHSNEK